MKLVVWSKQTSMICVLKMKFMHTQILIWFRWWRRVKMHRIFFRLSSRT